jgi:hypothetical protein
MDHPGPVRVAVLGLYNSGSTIIAGVLHRLGVNMCPPFWCHSRDDSQGNHYEPYELSCHLREWWDEPRAVERMPAARRVCFLRHWAAMKNCLRPGPLGAKHPLLSLCARDLLEAWGDDTRFVWAWRPLDKSIARLRARGWFSGFEEALQQRLWVALDDFATSHPRVVKVEYARMKSDPAGMVRELAAGVGLEVSESQVGAAAGFVRP